MNENVSAPTLSDVAAAAGVSLATASRVINGSARKVAEGYRERVLEAAARVGYSPNLFAQAVARGASRIAALLVSDLADPYFSTIAAGVARAAGSEGLLVTVAVTERNYNRELELLRELGGLRPRLLIMVGSRQLDEPRRGELIQELEGFRARGGGLVLVGKHELPFGTIDFQNAAGSEALAAALVKRGHQRFAILSGPKNLLVARERVSGFVAGLRSHGIQIAPERLFWGEFSRDGGYRAMTDLLASGDRDTQCVFAVNDVMAIGALTALREAGLQAPSPIAIAGFDDITAARDAAPALTTVRVDLEGIGERAVASALRAELNPHEMLGAAVVIRQSA
jgi:LacI family transcriptional regulator